MGSFYTNITLQTTDQQGVAQYLNTLRRNAFVLPAIKELVMVCDEESDAQDARAISTLANQLSRQFDAVSIAIINFDDDILWYQLYKNGQLLDEYDSNPDYFEASEPRGPVSSDAATLCKVFHKPGSVGKVREVLHGTPGEDYVFENTRHADLAKALGWSNPYIFMSYSELAEADEGNDDAALFAKTVSLRWLKEQFNETDRNSSAFD